MNRKEAIQSLIYGLRVRSPMWEKGQYIEMCEDGLIKICLEDGDLRKWSAFNDYDEFEIYTKEIRNCEVVVDVMGKKYGVDFDEAYSKVKHLHDVILIKNDNGDYFNVTVNLEIVLVGR